MGEMIKMVVVPTLLSTISGFSLAKLEKFAAPLIENQEMKIVKGPAVRLIMEGSENDPVSEDFRFKITEGELEHSIFVGVFNGEANAVALETQTTGFADKIGMIVAFNVKDDTIIGLGVTTHKETPGLGANAKTDLEWAGQFKGKGIDKPIMVTNDGGDISSLGGATITSRAVCKGAMQAIDTYTKLKPQLLEKLKEKSK
jgi:electron transport complex protein RnfG